MNKKRISRRAFAATSTAAVAAFTIVPRFVLGGPGFTPPSEKLNIACIGVGGMGKSDLRAVSKENNIVALCDVDHQHAAESFKEHPNANLYKDFRIMLEKEHKNIDAVTVSTPDHTHAVAAMAAIKMGKHVYCQKPLGHDVHEVRALTEEARKQGVVTQMGVQLHAIEAMKLGVEIVKSGMIGKVGKVDVWSCKGFDPRARHERSVHIPKMEVPKMPIPKTLDWDLWLGPASYRPYHGQYLPASWRDWWEFGSGRLGDMGCHLIDPVFWALDLKAPLTIEAHPAPFTEEITPEDTIVQWEFAARGEHPPLTMRWYDGYNKPFLPPEVAVDSELPNQGCLFYGERGILLMRHDNAPTLLPVERMKDFKHPKQLFPRRVNHYNEWSRACVSGGTTSTNWDYAGPLTETVLLGNVAARAGKRIYWDSKNLNITNMPEANIYLKREYRKGWSL